MRHRTLPFATLFLAGVFPAALLAQDSQTDAAPSAAAVAAKLADPNTTLGQMSFPLDYIAYDGRVPGAGSQSSWRLSLQASLPYSLGEGVNLFVRSLIPIVLDQYLLGPELLMTKVGLWGAAGLLVTHQWDVAGEDSFDTSGRHGSRLSACVCSEAIGRHFEKMVF